MGRINELKLYDKCEKTLLSNQFVIEYLKNICVIFRTFCYRIRLETNNGFRRRTERRGLS